MLGDIGSQLYVELALGELIERTSGRIGIQKERIQGAVFPKSARLESRPPQRQ
jgi:hypothetical protein